MHYRHPIRLLQAVLLVLTMPSCASTLPSGLVLDPSGACFPKEFDPPKNVRYLYRTSEEIKQIYARTDEGRKLAESHQQALAFSIKGISPIVVLPVSLSSQRLREGWTSEFLRKHEEGHLLDLTVHNCLEEFRKNPQILNRLVKRG